MVAAQQAPRWRSGVVRFVARRPLGCFVALAYAWAWGWWIPLALRGAVVRAGSPWPSHVPGLVGPAIGAIVVTAVTRGKVGLAQLARRALRWQVGARWYAAVLAPLLVGTLALLARGWLGGAWPMAESLGRTSGLPELGVLGAFALNVSIDGLGEELGWRGFALAELQHRRGPLAASLVIGLMWAAWHAPLFWLVEGFRGFRPIALPGFVLAIAGGSVLLSWIYNRTGGSVLMVALWHAAYNLTTATDASKGAPAAAASALVMIWAVSLVILDRRAVRRDRPTPLRFVTQAARA